MHKKLKQYLKKYPLAIKASRLFRAVKLWLADISSAYMSRHLKMLMTPYGFKLTGSTSIHHIAMQKGTFDPEETLFLNNQFQSVDVFVDVGANIGFHTCLARIANKQVVTVEPLLKNLEYLYANLSENNWIDIEVFPLGLNEKPGLATLYGGSSTGVSLISGWAGSARFFRHTIPVSTLDILLNTRFSGKKLLIKIDVEGAEYPVLKGAASILCMQPKPTWIVEICLHEFHPEGINPNFLDTFNLFWQHGYEAHTADQRSILIQKADVDQWVKNGRCESGTINYVFSSTD